MGTHVFRCVDGVAFLSTQKKSAETVDHVAFHFDKFPFVWSSTFRGKYSSCTTDMVYFLSYDVIKRDSRNRIWLAFLEEEFGSGHDGSRNGSYCNHYDGMVKSNGLTGSSTKILQFHPNRFCFSTIEAYC